MSRNWSGNICAIRGCKKSSYFGEGSLFRFPKDRERCKVWASSCKRMDLFNKHQCLYNTQYRVCSRHFAHKLFLNDLKNRLQPHAIPTVHIECNSLSVNEIIEEHGYAVQHSKIIETKQAPATKVIILSITNVGNEHSYVAKENILIPLNIVETENPIPKIKESSKEENVLQPLNLLETDELFQHDIEEQCYISNEVDILTPSTAVEIEEHFQREMEEDSYISKENVLEPFNTIGKETQFQREMEDHSYSSKENMLEPINIIGFETQVQNKTHTTKNPLSINSTKCLTTDISKNQKLRRKVRLLQSRICYLKKKETQRQFSTKFNVEKATLKDFKILCDKFLPEQTANLIKHQADQQQRKPKGRRYSSEFKNFCVSLYFMNRNIYHELSKFMYLPSKRSLSRTVRVLARL